MSKIRVPALAAVLAAAVAASIAAVVTIGGHGGPHGPEARVSYLKTEDGRAQLAVQFRRDGGPWSERVLPELNEVPADATPGRWLNSSPVAVPEAEPEYLTLGILDEFGGRGGMNTVRAVLLAIGHVNNAGGVLGQPVQMFWEDNYQRDIVELATRMIEEAGVDAFIGPGTSGNTTKIGNEVAAQMRTPFISPSGTSPTLTDLPDDGFVFRTIISDAAQGPALADLVADEGYDNVAVAYRDDPYGNSLFALFDDAFEGTITSAAIDPDDEDLTDELTEAAAGGAEVLVVIAFTDDTLKIVPQSLENGIFEQFIFTDGSRSSRLTAAHGEALEGAKGTAPAGGNITEEESGWEADYMAIYGLVDRTGFVREAYDAAIALMLAAEFAGTTDGTAIRDALPLVAAGPGKRYAASGDGVAAALAAIRGGATIDLDGQATDLDWDENGDITSSLMGIWQISGGEIEDVRQFPVDLATAASDREGNALSIGTEPYFAPFTFLNDEGELDGFERELGDELCRRTGYDCTWVLDDWADLIESLRAGEYDLIIAAMPRTEARDELIDFTQGYHPPGDFAYIARAGADESARSGRVAALVSTIDAEYVADETDATLVTYGTYDDAVEAVRDGEADAVFAFKEYLHAFVEESGGELIFVGGDIFIDAQPQVGYREGEQELGDKFDAAISATKADGSLNELLAKWFADANPVPQYPVPERNPQARSSSTGQAAGGTGIPAKAAARPDRYPAG